MFSQDLINQFSVIYQNLLNKEIKIVTAESCTGGLLSSLFTELDGSSKVFERGFVTYSNISKIELLNVNKKLIENHGAVSDQVALSMAIGALKNSQAQLAVSITGIAGPSGETNNKEVGTVFIALVANNYQNVKEFNFRSRDRHHNRESSLKESLNLIQNYLQL